MVWYTEVIVYRTQAQHHILAHKFKKVPILIVCVWKKKGFFSFGQFKACPNIALQLKYPSVPTRYVTTNSELIVHCAPWILISFDYLYIYLIFAT